MAFTAILRRSASSLAPLVSRLAGVNINYRSAFLTTASSHLNRKPTLKYFMSAFDFSSANEIQNPTWDELLSQINELEIKFSVHDSVLEIPSDFSFKIEDSPGKYYYNILLTREYNGELVKAFGYIYIDKERVDFDVIISKYGGRGPSLKISCVVTSDEIKIKSMGIIDSENFKDPLESEYDTYIIQLERYDENLKKAFLTYLEVRGIKPSMGEFLLRYQMNKKNRENLMELKKIRNFIEHLSRHHTISNHS
ncbi:hypothetical protein JRO89_XS14G0074800 [Xanthoceras sorbifolium]|uniref:Uncharacterized protein n=1 Tax=Xanthoceras sorbifolium TaxID=99658 RepID=A0ABQ8H4C8_9ROSI|nr:hypothetical protein JRO89_XS14G0074800 [Xanthoceras sorbifolium]